MMKLPNGCLILEGGYWQAQYSSGRLFYPGSIHSYAFAQCSLARIYLRAAVLGLRLRTYTVIS